MKRSIRVARQPWTSDLSETFQTRIFEKFILENFPDIDVKYVGRDFPLVNENNYKNAFLRNIVFTGNLTDDALYFLDLQPKIATLAGIQIKQGLSPVRGRLGLRQLFLSETFRREFSRYNISTQDVKSQEFLNNFGIECPQVGFISILLGTLSKNLLSSKESTPTLFLDVTKRIQDIVAKSSSSTQKFELISTKISGYYGEMEKNRIIDKILNGIATCELLVTTNPIYSTAALSLGKKVILISNSEDIPFNLSNFSEDDLSEHLLSSELFDVSFSLPLEEIHKRQSTVTNFLKASLERSIESNLAAETTAYKNQVITEVINSILENEENSQTWNSELQTRNSELQTRNSELQTRNSELQTRVLPAIEDLYSVKQSLESQIHYLENSRSWRVTKPLRRIHGYMRRFRSSD